MCVLYMFGSVTIFQYWLQQQQLMLRHSIAVLLGLLQLTIHTYSQPGTSILPQVIAPNLNTNTANINTNASINSSTPISSNSSKINNNTAGIVIDIPQTTQSISDIQTLTMEEVIASLPTPSSRSNATLASLASTPIRLGQNTSCRANQTFNSTSKKCQCDATSILFDNICFKCLPGSFKDGDTCSPCPLSCLVCSSSLDCSQCQSGHTFDAFTSQCKTDNGGEFGGSGGAQFGQSGTTTTCGANQKLVNGRCECDEFSILLSQNFCFRCVPGSFKQGPTCLPCIDQCEQCTNASICLRCVSQYVYNSQANTCQRGVQTCSSNRVLVKNICQCNSRSVQFNGQCVECPLPTYKDPVARVCQPCAVIDPECASCANASTCLTCFSNLKVGASGKCECLPPFFQLDTGCQQCPPGFQFSAQLRTCINPNLTNTTTGNSTINNTTVPGNTTNTTNTNSSTTNTSNSSNSNGNNSTNSSIANTTTTNSTTNNTSNSSSSNTTTPATTQCKQNEILQQSQCVCNQNTVNSSGQCLPCQPGSFKFGDMCIPCPDQCLQCTTFVDCLQCQPGHTFNAFFNLCEPTCQANQILQDGQCVCDQTSARNVQGVCQACPERTVKFNETCTACSNNCLVCSTPTICTQCAGGLVLNLATSSCCSTNQRYVSSSQRCECNVGFRNISGSCGVCPQGRVYVETTQLCVQPVVPPTNATPVIVTPTTCPIGEVLVNNSCTCVNQTVRSSNGACQPCPARQYAQSGSCQPCLTNCLNCTNAQTCAQCQTNYTGVSCQLCANGYIFQSNTVPRVCVLQQCGNGVLSALEECDDGNRQSGDGCTGACLIENGYVCRLVNCTRVIRKTEESINSLGVVLGFKYLLPELATSASLTDVRVTNGSQPGSIRIIRPPADPTTVKVLLDYCGLLPEGSIIVQLSSSSQAGTVRYVSQYDLENRVVVPRTTVSKSLKEPDSLLV